MKKAIFLICMVLSMMTGSCVLDPPPPDCTEGYHRTDEETCTRNSTEPTACGYPEVNCLGLPGFSEAKCYEGECSATACQTGFHQVPIPKSERKTCAEDTVSDCGPQLQDCSRLRGADIIECREGVCVAIHCKDGFFDQNGVCLPDNVASCGSNKIDCKTKFSHYREISCDNEQCLLISCEAGYHINNNDCEGDISN